MKIVFLDEYSLGSADLSEIKSLGEYIGYENTTTKEDVVKRAQGAQVIITNKVVICDDIMSQLPDLKLICLSATGMNNIDLDAAKRRGVEIRNVAGYSTHSVAEATISSALGLLRNVVYFDNYFKDGSYSASQRIFNFDRPTQQLHNKNWGVIGMGNIGREVARLASAFGCNVSYYSTSGVTREEEYPALSLEELLRSSDVISIHSPLNKKTADLIGENELKLMKPTAVIINVARGGIINESALASALNQGAIFGAALDVFSQEPLPSSSPLLSLNDPYRLLASPHPAWASSEAIETLVSCIARNITDAMLLH